MNQALSRLLNTPVFQIDANLINARQKLPEVNQMEKWANDDVILINMSSIARSETLVGNFELRVKKANTYIFTVSDPVDESDSLFKHIELCLFPNGAKDENQKNDVLIVCEASKYQAILVTNDGASKSQPGGILGNRAKFEHLVRVMSPKEATEFIAVKIQERDQYARELVRMNGNSLPFWVGVD